MMIHNNRVLLLAGILSISAAAWSGFLLGRGTGGAHADAFMPPPSSAPSANHQQTVRPAVTRTETEHSQQHSIPLADPTSLAATSAGSSSSFSNAAQEVSPAATPAKVRRPQGAAATHAPPRYPMVMLDLPPETLSSHPGLMATIGNLRDKFIASIGGADQNPAAPDYHDRWVRGASSIDEQLKAAIGWQAYNELQVAYAKKAAQ